MKSSFHEDDPRLTAYALGELSEDERIEIAELLENNEKCRSVVEEIRQTARLLEVQLAAEPEFELTDDQRETIISEISSPVTQTTTVENDQLNGRSKRWLAWTSVGLTLPASVLGIVFMVGLYERQSDLDSTSNALVEKEVVADQTVLAARTGTQYPVDYGDNDSNSDGAGFRFPNTKRTKKAPSVTWKSRAVANERQDQFKEARNKGRALPIAARPRPLTQGEIVEFSFYSGKGDSKNSSGPEPLSQGDQPPPNLGAGTRYSVPAGDSESADRGRPNKDFKEASVEQRKAFQRRIKELTGDQNLVRPRKQTGGSDGGKSGNGSVRGLGTATSESKFEAVRRTRGNNQEGDRADKDKSEAIVRAPVKSESYDTIIENEFISPLDAPLSTFSVDVDTASYSNLRRFLSHGQWPPKDAVRIEELINYFHYDDPQPKDGHPFSVNTEVAACPWQPDHRLVRIGLQGKKILDSQRKPTNIVFLLDVSGSMRATNKLLLVKRAMKLLVQGMTEDDRIAIVTYAGNAGLALNSTAGNEKPLIMSAINNLTAGGSTNGEAGIRIAYTTAVANFIENGANRIILCTDGDFNVGVSSDDELVGMIKEKARSGVFLSIFGFGMGNLKDSKLEKLADNGNGHYGYIDNITEARKVFVEELVGTLYTIAKDVKAQIEFNPRMVGAYRLIGYENRMLTTRDFDDDRIDAGDIGSGHSVTVLYEIIPPAKFAKKTDKRELKYQKKAKTAKADVLDSDDKFADELLTLRLRYKKPDKNQSQLIQEISVSDVSKKQSRMSDNFEWATSVAAFGLLLRDSKYKGDANFDLVTEMALGSKGDDRSGHRREFIDLVYAAKSIMARRQGQIVSVPPKLSDKEALKKASLNGKFNRLLKKVEAASDYERYQGFANYGHWTGTTYAGQKDLPTGHWVYVYPNWYIWGEIATE